LKGKTVAKEKKKEKKEPKNETFGEARLKFIEEQKKKK
jgi:hypothetical protein